MSRGSRKLAALAAVVVPMGFVSSALAAGGEPPTISGESPTGITEYGATLEAQINPEGSETTFEVWIQCERPASGGAPCESAAVSPLGQDHLAGGSAAETVRGVVTSLQPGYSYTYWFVATNLAGRTEGRHRSLKTQPSGACDGSLGCPYVSELPEWFEKLSEEQSAQTRREYEARHARELEAQHAKEAEEQRAGEATEAREAAALKRRKEEEAAMTGGVSLAATGISVQRNDMALVKLECLGIESCHGKLVLSAKSGVKARVRKGKKARLVSIGTTGFTISGNETKTVQVKLDAVGRALLGADHDRLSASLALLELAPNPQNTQTKAVHLIEQKITKARKS